MPKVPMNFRMSEEAVKQLEKLVEYYSGVMPVSMSKTDLLHYAINKMYYETFNRKGGEQKER